MNAGGGAGEGGWFVSLAASLLGWLALIDGWMHGRMHAVLPRSRGVRVFRRLQSFRTVSAQFPQNSEGLVARSSVKTKCWGANKP